MEFLETHETINSREARKITFIHEDWKVKSIFAGWSKKKMIKQVDGTVTSQTKYRKWTREDDEKPEFSLSSPD